jgi:predicted amidohydrolase YtcJ
MLLINSIIDCKEGGLASFFNALILICLCGNVLAQSSAADLVIINANVRTMEKAKPRAEAIAVSGERITAVGSTIDISKLTGKNTVAIDAKGRLVLPGFNDAHAHFMAIGNLFSSIDLSTAKTEGDVVAKLKHYAKFLPKGRWILGGKLDPTVAISRDEIDAATPENPVFIYHSDPKTAVANGLALQLARVESSGGVLDSRGIGSVQFVVPKDHVKDWPAIAETASNYAASFGITSVQDPHSDDMAAVYRELHRQGKLKTRIYDCVSLSNWAKLAALGTKAAEGDAMVRTGCVKGFYDAEDPDTLSLAKNIAAADSAGLQVLIHAIGKDANVSILNAFEKAASANGVRDRRFRIEHAHNLRSVDIPRFARLKIIPSMQPILFFSEGTGVQDEYRRLLDPGAMLAFGADAPMRGFNPLEGINGAVNAGGKRGITVEEAVYAYTMGAAYAEFQEKEKGSIEMGKLADLVILAGDPFDKASDLNKISVNLTLLAGVIVYDSGSKQVTH